MSTLTKQWLQQKIADMEATRDEIPFGLDEDDSNTLAALRIALASLEAEPVAYIIQEALARGLGRPGFLSFDASSISDEDINEYEISVTPLYTAPQLPQPAVPDIATVETTYPDVQTNWQNAKMYAEGWNACRAAMLKHSEPFIVTSDHRMMEMPQVEAINAVTAMLQGADGTLTNEGTIPVTQFKPVADLYGLTSPTGGETSFTFDAVEARDFIDGGWSCQEYVELERFQEAITNHTEDKLAMVDHSGDSNNMVEPVTTNCKLRDAVDAIRNSGIAIDAEKIFAERDALNAPDCWCRTCRPINLTDMRFVVCPECGNKRCPHANDHRNACTGSNEPGQEGSAYPAASQQEVNP